MPGFSVVAEGRTKGLPPILPIQGKSRHCFQRICLPGLCEAECGSGRGVLIGRLLYHPTGNRFMDEEGWREVDSHLACDGKRIRSVCSLYRETDTSHRTH